MHTEQFNHAMALMFFLIEKTW